MFTPGQFRGKAAEYAERLKQSNDPVQPRDFQDRERRFTTMVDNEQWLADNYNKTIHAPNRDSTGLTVAEDEECMLRCLGAAVIMQWDTLPTKLQRELFDNASAMGELTETAARRGQIARFLHKQKKTDGGHA